MIGSLVKTLSAVEKCGKADGEMKFGNGPLNPVLIYCVM
jgi:hypothetical protein